jgi:hypothetical protein
MRQRTPIQLLRRLAVLVGSAAFATALAAGIAILAGQIGQIGQIGRTGQIGAPSPSPDFALVTKARAAPARRPPAHRAPAALQARCRVLIIHGLKTPAPFPRSLKHLRSRLTAKPFKVFRSFQLLRKKTLPLATGRLTRAPLVGPYRVEAQLLSRLHTRAHKSRLQMRLSLFRKRSRHRGAKRLLRTKLVIDQGGTLFLAGPRYKAGRLILALTCK